MRADQICGNLKQKVQDRPTEGGLKLALELRAERNNQVKKTASQFPNQDAVCQTCPSLRDKRGRKLASALPQRIHITYK